MTLLGHYFEIEQRLTEMLSTLLKRCMFVTPKLHKVLEIRASSDQNRNVEELQVDALRWHPSATTVAKIFNAIELLKEAGQVLKLEFSALANRYDERRRDSHPQRVCLDCQLIADLDISETAGAFRLSVLTPGIK